MKAWSSINRSILVVKKNNVCISCEGKTLREPELQEATHIVGAPFLQRIKVNCEKLRILLLWFLLCGGGALGMAKKKVPKTAASANINTVAGNVSDPDLEVFWSLQDADPNYLYGFVSGSGSFHQQVKQY
jgi:hypothetical protein